MNSIADLDIYKNASKKTQNALLENGCIVKIKKGEYLFNIRDKVNVVYLIISGYAVLSRDSDEHGVRNIFLLGQGSLLNEVILDGVSASISCLALSDLTVTGYPRSDMLGMMKADFSFNRYVINSMALKIRKLYHMLETSTKGTHLDHQTASRIWKFARDFGIKKDGYVLIPFELRITLLAGFVGSNRETISRIVKQMSEAGIVSIEKGECRIYDMDRLKDYGR